ncbi:ABC transporter substrate-binding protein [soil metagenome]
MMKASQRMKPEIARTRREWLVLTGSSVIAMAAAGVPGVAQAQGKPGGVLRVSAPANPTTMDPATGRHGNDHVFLFPVFDTLMETDMETLLPKPGIAQSWTAPDPLTFVLTIRPGVVFHDGTPCDAEAVRFNLERSRTDERSNVKIDLVAVSSVSVSGPNEVTLRLSKPDSVIPMTLADRAGMMSSPTALKKFGKESDRNPVGTGPWKLVSWADNEKLIYARNPQYWKKGVPLLDGLELSVITEVNTGLRSVTSGQNDFVYQLAPQQKPIVERSGLQLVQGRTLATVHLYLNYAKPPLDNQKVRLAMCHSVDRAELNRLTAAGLSEPTVQTLPKGHWAFDPSLENTYAYAPLLARKLLSEAGFPGGVDIEIYSANDQRTQQRQEVLIEQFRKSGIRLKFVSVGINDVGAKFMGEKLGQAALAAYTGRTDPSQFFSIMFDKTSFINASRMEGVPGLEAAMLTCRSASDIDERRKAIHKVLRMVNEAALYVPLLLQPEVDAMSSKVKGFKPNLLGKPRFESVYLG